MGGRECWIGAPTLRHPLGPHTQTPMNISTELVDLIVHATNKAIPAIQFTDGPLLSFIVIESADGMRGEKDYPHGTTDDDLVAAASIEGVQRFALMSSGSLQTGEGSVPVLLIHAAERGDPSGFVLGQRFVANQSPLYAEPQGQIEVLQVQENHFRQAPFAVSPDPARNGALLQESLVRFAKRLMGQAFHDDDPRVLSVALSVIDGEPEASGSFGYVHEPTQTLLQLKIAYRENRFVPLDLSRIDPDGGVEDAPEELKDAILAVY